MKIHIILAGLVFTTYTFCNVHPGLKEAIDEGNIKQAENLVNKIGVKDIYCPSSLSFNDAMKIYGKTFSTNPEEMWNKSPDKFIKNAEPEICKTSASLCKKLLQNKDLSKWKKYLTDILESKINQQQEKRTVLKKEYRKATKEECLLSVDSEKRKAIVYSSYLEQIFCDGKDVLSTAMCAAVYAPFLDSLEKHFTKKEKKCQKNPKKLTEEKKEEIITVNPFAYEIEIYGQRLTDLMEDSSVPFDEEELNLYRKLRKNRNADSSSIKAFVADVLDEKNFWSDENEDEEERRQKMEAWGQKVMLGCMAYDNIDSLLKLPFYLGGGKTNCMRAISKDESGNTWISLKQEIVIQILLSLYAKNGVIEDSLKTLACRLNKNIDKRIFKMTDVHIFDCNFK